MAGLESNTVDGFNLLIDAIGAIGGTICPIGNIYKYARSEDVPQHTMFVIMTDDMDSVSHRYSGSEAKRMIERQKKKYG